MSFRSQLLERAGRRKARVVLCEGEDPRVQKAIEQLRARNVVEPIVLGGDGLNPAKDPRVAKITGTGLGLTLAREVVRMHGGDITVESQIDQGSTFTMTLPAKVEAA